MTWPRCSWYAFSNNHTKCSGTPCSRRAKLTIHTVIPAAVALSSRRFAVTKFFSIVVPGRRSCCSSGWAVFGFLGPMERQLWTSLTIWGPPPGPSLQTNVTEEVHLAVRLRSFDRVITPVALFASGHRRIRMSDLYTWDDVFRKMQCYVWLSGRQLSLNGRHLWNDILHHWNGKAIASSPMQQPLPSLPVFCLKIFPPTTTLTEIFHPSANSSPTPAQLCRPADSQPGKGRSGLTPSLPTAHLETGQYKHSLCLEAAQ